MASKTRKNKGGSEKKPGLNCGFQTCQSSMVDLETHGFDGEFKQRLGFMADLKM